MCWLLLCLVHISPFWSAAQPNGAVTSSLPPPCACYIAGTATAGCAFPAAASASHATCGEGKQGLQEGRSRETAYRANDCVLRLLPPCAFRLLHRLNSFPIVIRAHRCAAQRPRPSTVSTLQCSHEELTDGHDMKWATRMVCGYCRYLLRGKQEGCAGRPGSWVLPACLPACPACSCCTATTLQRVPDVQPSSPLFASQHRAARGGGVQGVRQKAGCQRMYAGAGQGMGPGGRVGVVRHLLRRRSVRTRVLGTRTRQACAPTTCPRPAGLGTCTCIQACVALLAKRRPPPTHLSIKPTHPPTPPRSCAHGAAHAVLGGRQGAARPQQAAPRRPAAAQVGGGRRGGAGGSVGAACLSAVVAG